MQPHLLSGGQGGIASERNGTQYNVDPFANSDLYELLNATVERACQRGLEKLDEMKAKALSLSDCKLALAKRFHAAVISARWTLPPAARTWDQDERPKRERTWDEEGWE